LLAAAALKEEPDHLLAEAQAQIAPLLVDSLEGQSADIEGSSFAAPASLSLGETRALLQEVSGVYRIQITYLLVAALMQAFIMIRVHLIKHLKRLRLKEDEHVEHEK
jgi:hypothetical protein